MTLEQEIIEEYRTLCRQNNIIYGPESMLLQLEASIERAFSLQRQRIITELEGMKRKSGNRTNYVCPKCHYFGGKDTYCMYDRHKLVEETEMWEEPSDEYYNQALDDVKAVVEGEKI